MTEKEFNGILYCCKIPTLKETQVLKLLEDVFGLKIHNPEDQLYIDSLMNGETACIPVEWAKGMIDLKVMKDDACIHVGSHASSERTVVLTKIHPVVKAYLTREGISYTTHYGPSLKSLIEEI